MGLGYVSSLGIRLAHSLAVVPGLPLGLAFEVQESGLIWNII